MKSQAILQDAVATDTHILIAKAVIHETEDKAREAIFEILYSNVLLFEEALDNTKSLLNSIEEKNYFSDRSMKALATLEEAFNRTNLLFEETIDEIIQNCGKQLKEMTSLTIRLVDSLKETDERGAHLEKMIELILKNFKASMRAIINNVEMVIESTRKHTDLTLNINKRLTESLAEEIEKITNSENSRVDFVGWVSEWWKQNLPAEAGRKFQAA